MRTAVCPGSFDPCTNGHVDVFARAAELADEVVVAVLINQTKSSLFSVEERIDLLREVVAPFPNVRVGMAYGAQDREWMGRAGKVAIVAGTGFMVVTALLIWIAPRLFVSAYIDVADPANAAVVALAIQYLAVAAVFQLFDGAQAVGAGALRGLQDTRVPMIVAGFGYWVAGFGTAALLGFTLGWDGLGIWIGLAVGLVVVSALLLWRWAARERLGLVPGTR